MAYLVEDDVETLLGPFTIPATWSTGGATSPLSKALERAQQTIDSFTGNRFESTSRTFVIDGSGMKLLRTVPLVSWPIQSVASIWYRGNYEYAFDTQGEEVSSDDYFVTKSRRAIQRVDGSWRTGVQNYRLRLVFGYAEVPADVLKAAVLLVRSEIEPGWADRYESFLSEHHPDGYSFTRAGAVGKVSTQGRSTGIAEVDRLLAPFVFSMPSMMWA